MSLTDCHISLLPPLGLPSLFPSLTQLTLSVDGESFLFTPIRLPSSLKHCKIYCFYCEQPSILPSTIETIDCHPMNALSHCSFTPDEHSLPELKYFRWFIGMITQQTGDVIIIPPALSALQLETILFAACSRVPVSSLELSPTAAPHQVHCHLHHIQLWLPDNTVLGVFQFIPEHVVASLKTLYFYASFVFENPNTSSAPSLNALLTQWCFTLPVFSSLKIFPSVKRRETNVLTQSRKRSVNSV